VFFVLGISSALLRAGSPPEAQVESLARGLVLAVSIRVLVSRAASRGCICCFVIVWCKAAFSIDPRDELQLRGETSGGGGMVAALMLLLQLHTRTLNCNCNVSVKSPLTNNLTNQRKRRNCQSWHEH